MLVLVSAARRTGAPLFRTSCAPRTGCMECRHTVGSSLDGIVAVAVAVAVAAVPEFEASLAR